MTFAERKEALSKLSKKDRLILELAWKVWNNLILASQNTHSERLVAKYEGLAEDAILELEDLLIGDAKGLDKP